MSKIYDYLKEKAQSSEANRYFLNLSFFSEDDEMKFTYKELYEMVRSCKSIINDQKINKNTPCFIITEGKISDFVTFIAAVDLGLKPILVDKEIIYNAFKSTKETDRVSMLYNQRLNYFIMPSFDISKKDHKFTSSIYYNIAPDSKDTVKKSLPINIPDSMVKELLRQNINLDALTKDEDGDFGILSSGTTNKAKVIMINEDEFVKSLKYKYDITKEETYLTKMPISAISGLIFALYLPIIGDNKTICIESGLIYLEYSRFNHLNIILPSNYMKPMNIMNQRNLTPMIDGAYGDNKVDQITLLGDKIRAQLLHFLHFKIPSMPKNSIVGYYGRTENYGLISQINEKDMKVVYLYYPYIKNNQIIYSYDKEEVFEDTIQLGKRITKKSNIKYDEKLFVEVLPIAVLNNPKENINIDNQIFGNIIGEGEYTGDCGFTIDNKIYLLGRNSELIKTNDYYCYASAIDSNFFHSSIGAAHSVANDNKIDLYISELCWKSHSNNYRKAYDSYKDRIIELKNSLPNIGDIYFIDRDNTPFIGPGGKFKRNGLLKLKPEFEYGKFDINFNYPKIISNIVGKLFNRTYDLKSIKEYIVFPKKEFSVFDITKLFYLFRLMDLKEDEKNYYLVINDDFLFAKPLTIEDRLEQIKKLNYNNPIFNDYMQMIMNKRIVPHLLKSNEIEENYELKIFIKQVDDKIIAKLDYKHVETGLKPLDRCEFEGQAGVEEYHRKFKTSGFDTGRIRDYFNREFILDNDNNFYINNEKYVPNILSTDLVKFMYDFLINYKSKNKTYKKTR